MKAIFNVGECEGKAMNAPQELLESCWMLVEQDMMLDVAASIAATQPEIAVTLKRPDAVPPMLSLHWEPRKLQMKAS